MNAQPAPLKCRLCTVRLSHDNPRDDFTRAICGDCRQHPAARRLGPVSASGGSIGAPRGFTTAEKALIRKVYGYMAPLQLLALLNERLQADLGDAANLYTLDQLHAEIQGLPAGVVNTGDWSALRKYLAKARRAGLLEQVNVQVIDDFAVVFALSTAQQLRLKDIALGARETSHD
ncbi:hypothetical protein [Rhodanobacter sp. OR92]|uniref:hypothetical protein n=1 Tax=Rhodanobacter sp. OR92 TaxID=1076524 RepID=UPI0004827285|nr:hypothetical protein [Rhodanobacter sp. OR92]